MSHHCLMRMLVVFVAGSLFIGAAQAEDKKPNEEKGKPEAIRVRIAGEKAEGGGVVFRLGEAAAGYWLGLAVEAEDGHLEVEHVVPDSPAAKAGLKPEDVLLSDGKTPLKEVGALQKLVQASEGKPLSLRVRRDGKEITVEVKPEKRDGGQTIVIGEGGEEGKEGQEQMRLRLRQLSEELRKRAEAAKRPAASGWQRLNVPAVVSNLAFPEDLQVTIKKKGNNPTRIKVRQGAQTWTVKENELDKLPEPIRGHVARMLPGRAPTAWVLPGASPRLGAPLNPAPLKPQSTSPRAGAAIGAAGQPLAGAPAIRLLTRENSGELQKEVERLKYQLHELQEQVEVLRKKQ